MACARRCCSGGRCGRIETLRAQARPAPPQATAAETDNTIILTLTNQITQLKKQHSQELQELRAALEQAHGENLTLRRELARQGLPSQQSVR